MEIKRLKFDSQGKLPVIIQDSKTCKILALIYVGADELSQILQTGCLERFNLPAASLADVRVSSEYDSLLMLIRANSEVALGSYRSCFGGEPDSKSQQEQARLDVVRESSLDLGILLDELYRLITDRKKHRPEGSYTTYLFNSGPDRIFKKIAEEAVEAIIAAKNRSKPQVIAEVSDLLYHVLVMLCEMEIRLEDVYHELKKRMGGQVTSVVQ
ncbi:MAG: phosphoribosyl-ATP diphosphatase [Acidobacteriota bacterium]|nr:phosphoribosyl-ATP diphosphatase [Blastocatellia bacterium]MDW8412425.1 phosphoribosyl-ATP diphosphatase [Acidobacteriota bacterium]